MEALRRGEAEEARAGVLSGGTAPPLAAGWRACGPGLAAAPTRTPEPEGAGVPTKPCNFHPTAPGRPEAQPGTCPESRGPARACPARRSPAAHVPTRGPVRPGATRADTGTRRALPAGPLQTFSPAWRKGPRLRPQTLRRPDRRAPDALRPAGTRQPIAETAPGHTRAPSRNRRTRQPRTRAPQSPRTPPWPPPAPPDHSGPRAATSLPPPAGKVAPRLTRQPRARPAAGHRCAPPLAPLRGRPRRAGRPGRGRRARAPLRCVAASPLPSMNGALSSARLRTGLALAAPRSAVPHACAGRSRGRGRGAGRDLRWPAGGARPRGESALAGPHRLPSKGDGHISLKTLD